MSREADKQAYEAAVLENKNLLASNKAHLTRQIKHLLIPYLQFKLYMVFPRRSPGGVNITKTIYGNEHSVTYKQCLFNKVPHIELNRLKGYNDLIRYVENDIKGQYLSCKIFGDDGTRTFPTLCRHYYKGGLEDVQDPVISEDDKKLLWFTQKNERLVILETNPLEENFKELVSESLNI